MKEITQEQREQLLNLNDSRVNEILGVATLKDNTWYIYDRGSLQFNIKDGMGYGLGNGGDWRNEVYWLRGDYSNTFREATHEEVENALIAEAKRRGFTHLPERFKLVDGDLRGGFTRLSDSFYLSSNMKTLTLDSAIIFKNGKWAEVIELKPTKQEIINQINELLNLL